MQNIRFISFILELFMSLNLCRIKNGWRLLACMKGFLVRRGYDPWDADEYATAFQPSYWLYSSRLNCTFVVVVDDVRLKT